MWYKFSAYNDESYYGWTQSPAIAEAVADRLSQGRDVNLYSAEALSDDPVQTDDHGSHLDARSDLICTDDTTLEEAAGPGAWYPRGPADRRPAPPTW